MKTQTADTEERDHLGQLPNPAIAMEKKTIEEAGNRPPPEKDWRKPGEEGTKVPADSKQATAKQQVDYESQTVPELRELAKERGVEIGWDARKDEIIEALEKS